MSLDGVGVVDLGEERGRVGELALEVEADFLADGVAAGTDAGADGGDEVFGARAKLQAHGADAALDDAGERAAPASVEGGDDAAAGVGDEDGHAIGGEDGEEDVATIRDEGVATQSGAAFRGDERRCIRVDDADEGAVKLADGDELARL